MKIKRIKLKKLQNTRDLGGIKTTDGKTIVSKRLIRSSNLGKAAPEDISILTKQYNLKHIIDLRTEVESLDSPDPEINGVQYTAIRLLDDSFFGIARDKYSMETWLNIFRGNNASPEKVFSDMYIKLVLSDRVKPLVAQFFDILLNNDSGSVLWHCSAGKDRVGVITALLLCALGVDRDTVIKDYLMTSYFCRGELIKIRLFAPFKIKDKNVRKCVYILFGVKKEYLLSVFNTIDSQFGGIYPFLAAQFNLTEEKITALKKKYLI